MQALGRFVADLEASKIPACAKCGSANPRAERSCPACGVPHPGISDARVVKGEYTGGIPWHARILLSIGAGLHRLARWLQRS